MKQQLSKWLSVILPVALGFYLIYYTYSSFSETQVNEIKGYFRNADYSYIWFGAAIAIFGNALRAYRWKYPLEQMGYKTTFANNFMAVNIGYLLNLTVPKSGEISRAVVLKKYNGVPFDKGFGSIVAERIVDMIILLCFMVLAFFLQFDIVKAFILDKLPINKLLLYGGAGFVMCIVLAWIYMYSQSKYIKGLRQKVAGLKEGLFSLWMMEKKWQFALQTCLIWASYVATFYVTLFVFRETSTLSADGVVTAFVVGSIAIAFTNSGFGSYPFLISKILLFYAVSETVGNAFGWIVWTSQMFVVLVLGLLSFLLLPILNRRK